MASFAGCRTECLWQRQRGHGLPPQFERVASRKLTQPHRSRELRDLRLPPGNHLEALQGERTGQPRVIATRSRVSCKDFTPQGQHTIRVNVQRRLCFHSHEGDAYDVEIVDYD